MVLVYFPSFYSSKIGKENVFDDILYPKKRNLYARKT